MQSLIETFKKTKSLHHAYLIEGERDVIVSDLIDFFNDVVGIATRGNPDFYYAEYATFGIDESRFLQNLALKKAIRDRKIFIISFSSMTREAQNSLLKLFEEPAAHTHFFLITSSAASLVMTLRSRLFMLRGEVRKATDDLVKIFLSSSQAERLQLLKSIVEAKNREEALNFLHELENVLHIEFLKEQNKELQTVLEEIEKHKKYLHDRASSVKMILEHIAIISPQLKF